MSSFSSLCRFALGLALMAVATFLQALLLIALMPWRTLRIKACNYWGHFVGGAVIELSGSPMTIRGREHLDVARPAIYVSNHTSALDIFIGIHLGPVGVVGVAKKEVVFYPFFGQLYALSGHLLLDRGNHERAIAAMKGLADIVRRYHLSIWMWPEGTRSRDGRLQPFKKGLWHLAVSTGLPVVPVVVTGAHRAWEKGTYRLSGQPTSVTILPAIDTSGWEGRDPLDCMGEVHALFVANLPADQLPA